MAPLPLSQRELFFVVHREFLRLRPSGCFRCQTPPPIRSTSPEAPPGAWQVPECAPCPQECDRVLASIVSRLQPQYSLAPESSAPP